VETFKTISVILRSIGAAMRLEGRRPGPAHPSRLAQRVQVAPQGSHLRMTDLRIGVRISRRRDAFRVCAKQPVRPKEIRGAQGMPGARCTRSLACKIKQAYELVTTVTPVSPGIPPAQWFFTAYFALSPVDQALFDNRRLRFLFAELDASIGAFRKTTTTLARTPAGRARSSAAAANVHRIPPRVS